MLITQILKLNHQIYNNLQMQQQKENSRLIVDQQTSTCCQICYCQYTADDLSVLRQGSICYSCWHQHIQTAITRISYKAGSQIISPFEGRQSIDVVIALNSLKAEHSSDLQEWLFKKYTAFTPDIQKCPSQNCNYVFTSANCGWSAQQQKCPSCETVLAANKVFDINTLIGLVYFLFLTNKCPKCQIPIEKTTGCPHMTCPCGHQFCWYCLKDYFHSPTKIYSVHEPKQCAFIFFSKLTFTFICVVGIVLTFFGNQVFQQFMQYFFLGIKYVIHALMLDIIVVLNVIGGNQIYTKYRNAYNNYHLISNKMIVGGMIGMDLIIILILAYFQLLTSSGLILLVQLGMVGVGALSVWLIVFSVQTWFEYIC